MVFLFQMKMDEKVLNKFITNESNAASIKQEYQNKAKNDASTMLGNLLSGKNVDAVGKKPVDTYGSLVASLPALQAAVKNAENSLYNYYFSCSMPGGKKVDPIEEKNLTQNVIDARNDLKTFKGQLEDATKGMVAYLQGAKQDDAFMKPKEKA